MQGLLVKDRPLVPFPDPMVGRSGAANEEMLRPFHSTTRPRSIKKLTLSLRFLSSEIKQKVILGYSRRLRYATIL